MLRITLVCQEWISIYEKWRTNLRKELQKWLHEWKNIIPEITRKCREGIGKHSLWMRALDLYCSSSNRSPSRERKLVLWVMEMGFGFCERQRWGLGSTSDEDGVWVLGVGFVGDVGCRKNTGWGEERLAVEEPPKRCRFSIFLLLYTKWNFGGLNYKRLVVWRAILYFFIIYMCVYRFAYIIITIILTCRYKGRKNGEGDSN